MNITDYSKLSITELCRLYGDASAALELATNRKVIDGLVADMKAAYTEAKRRDDEVAALRTELAAAMTEIASQNMTIKTLSEHIANSIDDGEEWLESYVGTGGVGE